MGHPNLVQITLAYATCLPYKLPVTTTYLPLGSEMVDRGTNGIPFLINMAVSCVLYSFFEQNIGLIQAFYIPRYSSSCLSMYSECPPNLICLSGLLFRHVVPYNLFLYHNLLYMSLSIPISCSHDLRWQPPIQITL